jgi:glucose/arabinose dehydrogenase
MGPATAEEIVGLRGYKDYQYSDPEFSWEQVVAPTGLAFVQSEPLKKFSDSLFVGDCNHGNLYRFTLNDDRDDLAFAGAQLSDKVANRGDSQDEIIFGTGFGCLTDIEVGPDGLLYIVSLSEGAIFRILPEGMVQQQQQQTIDSTGSAYPYYGLGAIAAAGIVVAAYAIRKRKRM